jgi:HEAT repeat protein
MPFEWLTLLPADPVLRLASYTAFALGGLTLAIMLQVLMLSEIASRRQRSRHRFDVVWQPRLAMCSLGYESEEEYPALPRRHRAWFLLLWNRIQRQLRGTARLRMNRLFLQLGMDRYALGLLQGRAIQRRLVALASLGFLAEETHWSAVAPLLRSRNPTVSLAAAQTLVAIGPNRAMMLLIPQIPLRLDWASPRVAALCQQAGSAAVTAPLLEALESAGADARQRLVPLLDWAEPRQAAPWARRIIDQGGEPEAILAALHCLGELGDPRDRERILDALQATDAVIRQAAVEAFRQLAQREDDVWLLPLLADRSWWVRQSVADTLLSLPGIDEKIRQHWLSSTEDRYGRDALKRAMVEKKT